MIILEFIFVIGATGAISYWVGYSHGYGKGVKETARELGEHSKAKLQELHDFAADQIKKGKL